MATMSFCGATGLMYRGARTPASATLNCTEPEREGDNCWCCSMFLTAHRRHNDRPYDWGGILVTGIDGLKNRRKCGEIVRENQKESK